LGNPGFTLVHLARHGEALPTFEQIIDATDNPAELWAAYTNIGQIYDDWGRAELSERYRHKATELKPAAEERLSEYTHRWDAKDLVGRLTDAILQTETKMEDPESDR
jgi:tetratricopeptide (TPR) repeat protein